MSLRESQIVAPARKRSILMRWLVLLAAVLVVLLVAAAAFRGAGRWLVRPNPPERADAIVVLSGSMPYRAEEAANLYRAAYAPAVWITRPENPGDMLDPMGIHYLGEQDYNRQILLHAGVPDQAIRVLPGTIVNTEQELSEVALALRQEGKSSVLIVTSPEHTRRVRALWKILVGSKMKAIVCAAPQDPFDADHWWRNTRDAFAVAREMMGLLNAWLGLPVRPPSH